MFLDWYCGHIICPYVMTKQFLMHYFGLTEIDRAKYPHLFLLIDSCEDVGGSR